MVMRALFLFGRLLLGAYYLFAASGHFAGLVTRAEFAAAKGVPLPHLAVLVSGLLLVIAGVSILLGFLPKVGVAALALFFIPVTFIMHAFWRDADPAMRMMDMVNFSKNIALLASSLMFLAIPEPWPASLH